MSDVVADGKVISIQYTLKDDEGVVIDSSNGRSFAYLHGANNLITGLEAALDGKPVGEAFQVTLAPKDAYGEKTGDGPQPVHRSELPKGVRAESGTSFRMPAGDGKSVQLWITQVKGSRVWIDANHPMAGKTLHFDVSVDGVRNATAEEIAHGHAHGNGGHAH